MCLLGQLISSLFLFLITRTLSERFGHVTEQLQKLAYSPNEIDPSKVDQHLNEFNVVIDQLLKCNFFWGKVITRLLYYSLKLGLI